MNPPPLPADDAERVQLVHELALRGDPSGDGSLDALVRLAAALTLTPMAGLSLVDDQEQWFVAAVGLPRRVTARAQSFCAYTILSPEVLVVHDACADTRFVNQPWVADSFGVRFYAGAPVFVDARCVGCVCCMDVRARRFDTTLKQGLCDLAAVAGAMLQQRLEMKRLSARLLDVTSRRHAESTLRQQQAAELAHVAKSEFLSRMSHEMRTPLNAVIGFTQLLLSRSGTPDAAEVRDYAEHVLHAGEHLLALTNDVLDLQHVEEGRAALDLADVPLDRVVASVIASLSDSAQQRGVHFDNHVPNGVAVRADEQRLRQVLLNVVSNAVKYNRPAGVVRCSVDQDSPPGRVRVSIEDTGSGLKPDQLQRLFQPFERLGRETSTIEGTGLGLIIARSLVSAMGGGLRVASSAGVGTRVVVELLTAQQTALPFAAPTETAAPKPADAITGNATMLETPPSLRMLYVEDNRINAILFEQAIRLRKDVELRVAEDGTEALDQVRDWKPDVLVLDAHLPGMDGFELLSALRLQPGLDSVPAFMCSADAMPDDVERAAAAGFAGYWPKPINIARIMNDLDRLSAGLAPTNPDRP